MHTHTVISMMYKCKLLVCVSTISELSINLCSLFTLLSSVHTHTHIHMHTHTHAHTHIHSSYMTLIGVHEMHS